MLVEVHHDEHGDGLKSARGVFGEELRGTGSEAGAREPKVRDCLSDVRRLAAAEVR